MGRIDHLVTGEDRETRTEIKTKLLIVRLSERYVNKLSFEYRAP